MMMRKMCHAAEPVINEIFEHPFNKKLYDGTLSKKLFRDYLEQDFLYLHDFSRALCLTSSRFNHDGYTKQFNIFSANALAEAHHLRANYLGEHHSPALFGTRQTPIHKIPVIEDYTNHLLATAANSSIEEAVASLLPCFWIYSKLGLKMPPAKDHPYYHWISSYSNPQFGLATQAIIQIFEELSHEISCPHDQQNIISAFVKSSEYELLFWDSIYHKMDAHIADPVCARRLFSFIE